MIDSARSRSGAALAAAILVAAIAAAYSRAPTLPFVWDDWTLIVGNELIRDPGRFGELLGADLFSGREDAPAGLASEYFRPATTATFWLEARLFGSAPAAGHVTNVLLHGLATLLALGLLLALGIRRGIAVAAAAFFALNPIQTEAVYWISARGETLAAVFALAAALALSRADRPALRSALAGGLALLALLSKETAVGALPLVCAIPLLRRERPAARGAVVAITACAAALAGYALWRWRVGVFLPGDGGLTGGADLAGDFLTVAATLIRWCAAPFGPSAAHDFVPGGPGTWIAATAGLLAATALAAVAWRKGVRLPAASLAAFACHCLAVALAVRGIGVIGERYAYPAVLYVALFVAGVSRLRRPGTDERGERVATVARVAVLALLAALFLPTIWLRAGAWRSERALFADAIAATGASEAKRLLASHLAHRERDFAGAASLYRERVEARPLDARSWNNLAGCLIEIRRFEEAAAAAARARALDPGRRSAWLNEATALASLGRAKEALALLDAYRVWRPAPGDRSSSPLPVDARYREVRRMASVAAGRSAGEAAP
jgi:hypothetical protein